jgi:hypothetical protein
MTSLEPSFAYLHLSRTSFHIQDAAMASERALAAERKANEELSASTSVRASAAGVSSAMAASLTLKVSTLEAQVRGVESRAFILQRARRFFAASSLLPLLRPAALLGRCPACVLRLRMPCVSAER